MTHTYSWHFPLPRTHTGMLLGNGSLGALVWGEGNILRITFGRADFWDHRGGLPWKPEINYRHIRTLLEEKRSEELLSLFEGGERRPGQPRQPSVLPLGRIEVELQPGDELLRGAVHVKSGEVTVDVRTRSRGEYTLLLGLSMSQPLFNLRFPGQVKPRSIRTVAAWEYVGAYLESISFPPPEGFSEGGVAGFVQAAPADPSACLAHQLSGSDLFATVAYGDRAEEAKAAAKSTLELAVRDGVEKMRSDNDAFWYQYWRGIPRIDIPNERLSFLYHYGMYKFAGLTHPDGVAATLQGPWIEEYQMPPWSSDYHFNINVQMCYWPAYRSGLFAHLKPLFALLEKWMPQLRENARLFLGIEDGVMLPHAVDDRGTGMGGFWTGALDHGCTAWVARMMWDYCRYSGDTVFLRQSAYPFMAAAMRVYEGMLERTGDAFALPVGVSPEYRGAQPHAWGRNPSFQLACIHSLCESLLEAARLLDKEPNPLWRKILKGLPKASFYGGAGSTAEVPPGAEIGLWDGLRLEESHRHHSHLAGLYPFDIFDLERPEYRDLIEKSFAHWIAQGMGQWSGWCVPWAAILHLRLGNGEAAELLLETWERLFTNEGHGTLHDPAFPGITLLGTGPTKRRKQAPNPRIIPGAEGAQSAAPAANAAGPAAHSSGAEPAFPGAAASFVKNSRSAPHEIMQMDAGMAATAAVMEMLLFTSRGVNHVFSGIPSSWKNASFQNLRTEGAFAVGASLNDGKVRWVTVKSEIGGPFRLKNPFPGPSRVRRANGAVEKLLASESGVFTLVLGAGETAELSPWGE